MSHFDYLLCKWKSNTSLLRGIASVTDFSERVDIPAIDIFEVHVVEGWAGSLKGGGVSH